MSKVIPFPKSTSLETNTAIVVCKSCQMPLWEMEIRIFRGTVASSNTKCVGKNTQPMSGKSNSCPLCSRPIDDKGKIVLKTRAGQTFVL